MSSHGANCKARAPRWAMALASLMLAPFAVALDSTKHLTQYILSTWQAEQGLPQNTVLSIARTLDGYLWVGTQEGVARFDGVKFTVFNRINTPELRGTVVYALCADAKGRLWIGSDDGLVLYEHGVFRRVRGGAIHAIAEDHTGAIWIASADSLEWIASDLTHSRVYTAPDGLVGHDIQLVYEDRQHTVWTSTRDGGLQRWDSGRFVRVMLDSEQPSTVVSAIAEDARGVLWMGTRDGRLYSVSSGQIRRSVLPGIDGQHVRALLPDTDGTLLIALLGGGLRRLRGESVEQLTTEDGLPSNDLHALYMDREGSIWIGTSSGGLARLRDGKFTPFGAPEGLIGGSAWSVAELRDGSLLVGTDRGLSSYRNGRFEYLSTRYDLGPNAVRAILVSRDGDIWLGVDTRGVYRLHGAQTIHYLPAGEPGERSDRIFALFEDSAGRIWAGAQDKLYRAVEGKLIPETAVESIGNTAYGRIAQDRSGRLVFATESHGVWVLDGSKLARYDTAEGLPSHMASALHIDDRGVVWVGTAAGLARIFDGRVSARSFPTLLQQTILGIFEDRQHQLWLTTNKGLFSISRHAVDAYFDGSGGLPEIRGYDIRDGMRSSEFNGGTSSAGCFTHDGELWLVTIRGLLRVNPANIPINSTPPAVVIERLIADGKPLQLDGRVEIPPGGEKWEFKYTALSLRASERQRFRYKLEGYDRNWVEAGDRRSAYYTHLPPGDYTFRVVASNDDGIWNLRGASARFRLEPHFYETRLFYALCIVIAGWLVVMGHRARVRHMRRRAAELETLVAERTADLAKAREELLDASRKAGRAEIAASVLHNIGNVLNSLNVSADLLAKSLKKTRLSGLARLVDLFRHKGFETFVASERGRHLPEYLTQLSHRLAEEHRLACTEVATLQGYIGRVRDILVTHQVHVSAKGLAQTVSPVSLVEDAVAAVAESVERNGITVLRELDEHGPIVTDKHRVLQILIDLIRNAVQACVDSGAPQKQVKVRIEYAPQDIAISVTDNGVGITAENLKQIFSHNVNTRSASRSFGLHNAALAAREIGGTLAVHSDGPGRGATFTLKVPHFPDRATSEVA